MNESELSDFYYRCVLEKIYNSKSEKGDIMTNKENKTIVIGHGTPVQATNVGCLNVSTTKKFNVEKLEDRVILPEAHLNAAGLDLRVLTDDEQPVTIKPGEFRKFRTGIKIEPPIGEYVRIYVRSSVGCKKHLALMNGTGIIDNDYRGEILVFVWNFGKDDVVVEDNERLCQMIFDTQLERIPMEGKVSETQRGEGGFGSSGVK